MVMRRLAKQQGDEVETQITPEVAIPTAQTGAEESKSESVIA